jgi:hypothetical protein
VVNPSAEAGLSPQTFDQRRLGFELAVDDLERPLGPETAGRSVDGGMRTVTEASHELVAAHAGTTKFLNVYHFLTVSLLSSKAVPLFLGRMPSSRTAFE